MDWFWIAIIWKDCSSIRSCLLPFSYFLICWPRSQPLFLASGLWSNSHSVQLNCSPPLLSFYSHWCCTIQFNINNSNQIERLWTKLFQALMEASNGNACRYHPCPLSHLTFILNLHLLHEISKLNGKLMHCWAPISFITFLYRNISGPHLDIFRK